MRRVLAPLAVVLATGALTLVTADTVASASVPAKAAPLCAGKTKGAATKAIKKTWDTVLNGSLPLSLDQKFKLIQGSEDPAFNATLHDIAAKNAAMLKTTSVKVNAVTCTGKKAADVKYDLVLAGQVAAGIAPPGAAALDKKQWKMTKTTVCDLFGLADPTLSQSGPCAA